MFLDGIRWKIKLINKWYWTIKGATSRQIVDCKIYQKYMNIIIEHLKINKEQTEVVNVKTHRNGINEVRNGKENNMGPKIHWAKIHHLFNHYKQFKQEVIELFDLNNVSSDIVCNLIHDNLW